MRTAHRAVLRGLLRGEVGRAWFLDRSLIALRRGSLSEWLREGGDERRRERGMADGEALWTGCDFASQGAEDALACDRRRGGETRKKRRKKVEGMLEVCDASFCNKRGDTDGWNDVERQSDHVIDRKKESERGDKKGI